MARELPVFCDESGSKEHGSRYYLITLVFHDQYHDIARNINDYEANLARKQLPDIPFHASPLMNGHDGYEHLDMEVRKKLLASFAGFVRRLPISYQSFSYVKREFKTHAQLEVRMYQTTEQGTIITFYRPQWFEAENKSVRDFASNEEAAIHLARTNGTVTGKALMQLTGVSRNTAGRTLSKLAKSGQLEWHGSSPTDPSQYYTLSS